MPVNRRLKGYDYRQPGGYFITINSFKKLPAFSAIKDGIVELSEIGLMIDQCWLEIPRHFDQIELVTHIVMPDHFHGILIINNKMVSAKHTSRLPLKASNPQDQRIRGTIPGSLSAIVQSFKSASSRLVHQRSNTREPIWQRSFYDRIIRNEKELLRIFAYIENNPFSWPKESDFIAA